MGWSIILVILGFAAAPFVIAAAAAALPFVLIGALFWFLITILRSQGLSDYLAAQRRKAQAVKTPPSSAYSEGFANVPIVSPPSSAPPTARPRPQANAGHYASGTPFRVYDALDSRPQRTVLYAEEYDDGRLKGYAVYVHRGAGMTIVTRAEFDKRYRRWTV